MQACGGNLESTDTSEPIRLQGGSLRGAGTITANVDNSGGVVQPGASPGILTINGNYTQGNGTLEIEVGGLEAGVGYDRLAVTGSASLGGTLRAATIDGFRHQAGDIFTVLTFGSRTGTFAVLDTALFTANVGATDVVLTSEGVPQIRHPRRCRHVSGLPG